MSSIHELYLARFDSRCVLSRAARDAFLGLSLSFKSFGAYRDIVREGERPAKSCLIVSGTVSRYKTLSNGARQIVSFHIRGDMVDLHSALLIVADHGIRTHVPTEVALIAHEDLLDLAAKFPDLGRALWFDTLVDAAIFREWTLNVGRRSARTRTAHLLLEMAYRAKIAGLADGDTFPMPVSQADLADAVGISPVHINRSLQWLRAQGLIRTHAKTVTIERWDEMADMADFTSAYMHPEGPREPSSAMRA